MTPHESRLQANQELTQTYNEQGLILSGAMLKSLCVHPPLPSSISSYYATEINKTLLHIINTCTVVSGQVLTISFDFKIDKNTVIQQHVDFVESALEKAGYIIEEFSIISETMQIPKFRVRFRVR